jgi:hypothetical protein
MRNDMEAPEISIRSKAAKKLEASTFSFPLFQDGLQDIVQGTNKQGWALRPSLRNSSMHMLTCDRHASEADFHLHSFKLSRNSLNKTGRNAPVQESFVNNPTREAIIRLLYVKTESMER